MTLPGKTRQKYSVSASLCVELSDVTNKDKSIQCQRHFVWNRVTLPRRDKTRPDKTARQDKTRRDKTRQDNKTRQGNARQDSKTRQDKTARQDSKMRQVKTKQQDKTRQQGNKTRQDKTRQGKKRQDKTRVSSVSVTLCGTE